MDDHAIYVSLIEAWNSRDARAFAARFASDAVVIGFDGSLLLGRSVVEQELSTIFANHPTAPYVATIVELRMLGAGVSGLRARVGMPTADGSAINPTVNAWQTMIVTDGLIAQLQTTPAQYHGRPELVEEHSALLAPLLTSDLKVSLSLKDG